MSIFSIRKHTIQESFESGHRKSHITSLIYTVITPRLRQNERNRAFGMLVAAPECKQVTSLFVALMLLFITS